MRYLSGVYYIKRWANGVKGVYLDYLSYTQA